LSLRSLIVDEEGIGQTNVPESEWTRALQDKSKFVWVDIAEDDPDVERILSDVFKFHPLAVEDALHQVHVPRVDDWTDYLYVVAASMSCIGDSFDISCKELDLFLGKNYLVSCHRGENPAVERVWTASQQRERRRRRGTDHLMYQVLDEIVSDYLVVVDVLDEGIDRTENEVFGNPTPQTLNSIFRLKHAMLDMRRVLTPMREVLNRLARDDYDQIDIEDRVYYRDVYDHLVRMVDINETLRDLVSGSMDMYLSVVSNRLNEIMKTLTVVTVLFMPVTAITGAMGMNFFFSSSDWQVPGGHSAWLGLAATISVCAATIGGLLLWMKRRGWVGGGESPTPHQSPQSQNRSDRRVVPEHAQPHETDPLSEAAPPQS